MSRRLAAYGVAVAWLALDRITKLLIQRSMDREEVLTVIPGFFNLVYTENRGIAFGMMSEGDSEWRAFFLIGLTLLVLGFVAAVLWQSSARGLAANRISRLGLCLVLGGALGNLYDRIASGAVTDFLDFYIGAYHWPSFNVADMGLTIGASLILLDFWLSRHEGART
jgi:signal peptidase II